MDHGHRARGVSLTKPVANHTMVMVMMMMMLLLLMMMMKMRTSSTQRDGRRAKIEKNKHNGVLMIVREK